MGQQPPVNISSPYLSSKLVCLSTYLIFILGHLAHLKCPSPKLNSWTFLLNYSPSEQKVPPSTHLLKLETSESFLITCLSFPILYSLLFFFYHPCHHSMSSHVFSLRFPSFPTLRLLCSLFPHLLSFIFSSESCNVFYFFSFFIFKKFHYGEFQQYSKWRRVNKLLVPSYNNYQNSAIFLLSLPPSTPFLLDFIKFFVFWGKMYKYWKAHILTIQCWQWIHWCNSLLSWYKEHC